MRQNFRIFSVQAQDESPAPLPYAGALPLESASLSFAGQTASIMSYSTLWL